jgi:ubiquinone/menaquinone biosynthesis C-methylase UbiE
MKLEERKIKEIEHSRLRRSILQGFERISDTNTEERPEDIESLINDKELFKKHFSNMKFYSITKSSEDFKWRWLEQRCKESTKILDFGCGNGENGIFAAKCGADVTGIDISPEGVENANLNAKKFQLDKNCKFVVMDGENMSFPDNTFDLAVEYGVLHHVDLEKTMSELSRVLKPEGEMICVEALRHNPLIHLYRKMTPHLRTKWEVEHILSVNDLDTVKKYFRKVEVRFFHLTSLLAVPFRKTPIFSALRNFLDRIDQKLLKNKFLGKYGWIMIFTISDPIKKND